ncbi:MAG: 50S ribosomal protein L15 [Chloroflexi bacterium]|jgi:large subunit ribosomal protein L15|nr:50S ribosomal protein L15 [Chloroflexota bacterium]MDL1883452.1 50S ribosomal protein L15 [Anaerolineae bacterium CFX8]GIL14768.1 MAG: 50S ribosomal protein L15 [Chloroflexota bacterium]
MKLHDLQPDKGSKKKRIRWGRGIASGHGRYSGRGIKGQGARRGKTKGAYFEGGQLPLVRRLPFKRGFTNIFRIEYQEVKIEALAGLDEGATVTPALLHEKRLIKDLFQPVVILGNGELNRRLTVKAHRFTKGAQEKITGAGGTVEIIPLRIKGAKATVRKLRKEVLEKLYSNE